MPFTFTIIRERRHTFAFTGTFFFFFFFFYQLANQTHEVETAEGTGVGGTGGRIQYWITYDGPTQPDRTAGSIMQLVLQSSENQKRRRACMHPDPYRGSRSRAINNRPSTFLCTAVLFTIAACYLPTGSLQHQASCLAGSHAVSQLTIASPIPTSWTRSRAPRGSSHRQPRLSSQRLHPLSQPQRSLPFLDVGAGLHKPPDSLFGDPVQEH